MAHSARPPQRPSPNSRRRKASSTLSDATWELLGGQSFDPSEATEVSADEFPSITRVLTFNQDIDGYLQDLGIDSTTILDDDEPVV
jgi:hypothetical protein